jgi:hypothetical protein
MFLLDYWRSIKKDLLELVSIAFDFAAILAISSEYKKIFSSYAKEIIAKSSRLTGEML